MTEDPRLDERRAAPLYHFDRQPLHEKCPVAWGDICGGQWFVAGEGLTHTLDAIECCSESVIPNY